MSSRPLPAAGLRACGCLILCLLAAAAAASPQDQLKQYRQNLRQGQSDLQSIQKQLRLHQQRILQGRQAERSLLAELQETDKRIEEAEGHYAESEANLRLVLERLDLLRASILHTETGLLEMKDILAARLRLRYLEGRQGFWRALLEARDLTEAVVRLKFFHLLSAQNAYWIGRLQEKRQELAREKQEWAEREIQARDLEAQRLKNLEKIREHKTAREQKLKNLRSDRAAHEQACRELNAASQRLTALITALKRQAADLERRLKFSGAPFAQRLGKLSWPTRGRIVEPFGKIRHPRFNTFMLHKGIDIAGPIGQNVLAAAPGNVLFAEWFEGYGRMIIVDHGNGFNTVYAHLAKITAGAGQKVEEGQVIGTLGDSGTWKGPALYFEIRHKGEAVDPLPWLKR